jgi:phage protein D
MPRTPEQVFISVDGAQVDLAAARLITIVIDQALLLPDAFTLVLAGGLEWLRDDTFAIGKELKVEMSQGGGPKRTLIVGEVTGLLPEMNESNEADLVVRGYDRSHRLQRGRYTRAFIQLTDSDIAQRIASEIGLGSDIEPTTEVYDHVFQQNQTNLEFLQERAARIGYQVGVSEGDLYFKPVGQPTSRTAGATRVTLTWGEDLWDFSVSRTTPGQATEVTVRGWDPVGKKAVVGQASSSNSGPETRRQQAGGEAVRSAFSIDAPMTVVREGITSQTEAENLAQVICDELHGAYTTAEGNASGNPEITPGATVEVEGAGVFDGRYIVSSATHRFDRNGYQTAFAVGGARAPSRIAAGEGRGAIAGGVSFAVGIVTNNEDDDDFGRVKVKFPTLADDLESHWCRLVTPMAGGGRGFFTLPEVNDEVLVAFERGASPVIIGSLWNGADKPPLGKANAVKEGKVVQRVWKSRSGHQILFDDSQGEEQLVIQDKKGNQVVFECKTDKIIIKTAGDIEVQSSGKLSVASKGDMTLSTQANMTIEASGNLDIKGTMINLNP